jgi:phenylalanyl-tRNA synthetase beta chain
MFPPTGSSASWKASASASRVGTPSFPAGGGTSTGRRTWSREVTRVVGYDAIPPAALPRAEGVAKPTATRSQLIERHVRRAAAARGLEEAVTWSFISKAEADLFGGAPHVLANPISEEMKHMRPSLIPGLAAAVRRNADRGSSSIRLFEVGRRYLADAERPTVG